ncbi:MAG: pantetheine-phosphate adenylyltransferase [Spirochaetales bacterium]|jgi:pantetheine-phosphate adenylyltransferase|nr:pantetheine-phosphate adenylyltransferase [Spirochaetales bacterium]
MTRVLFPGSFDPPTNGHMNLLHRAAKLWDEIDVVIAVNQTKTCTFTAEERLEMMKTLVQDYPNIKVSVWDRLIVDYAEQVGAKVIIRGVRAMVDFTYEFELSMTNKGLKPGIETIFMPTDPQYFVLRSSAIKEIALFGGDISSMVPPLVAGALKKKLEG